LLGIAASLVPIQFDKNHQQNTGNKFIENGSRAEVPTLVNNEILECLPVTLGYQGEDRFKSPEVKGVATVRTTPVKKVVVQKVITPIPQDPKNPNSIVIDISQAPPPASGKKVGDRWVCAKKNDHPRKSTQGKGIHVDRQCCLDPDEIPNPWCDYSYKP